MGLIAQKPYSVYMLKSKDGRVYIGMTSQSLTQRCRSTAYNGCPALKKAIAEYGWNFFERFSVKEGLSKTEAEELEKELIAHYDSTNLEKGFNVAYGGNIPGRHSKQTRQQMSESQKGRSFSAEHLHKLRKPKMGGSLKRRVLQYDIDGTLVRKYESVFDAATAVGGFAESIMRCCNRKQHTAKGYKWRYEEVFQ